MTYAQERVAEYLADDDFTHYTRNAITDAVYLRLRCKEDGEEVMGVPMTNEEFKGLVLEILDR